jgi:hypothetical protein
MATNTQEILAEADQLLQTVKNEEAPTEDTPFYGESSKEADAFLSGLRGTISKEQPQVDPATVSGFSPEVMKLLQESEDLIKGYSTGSPFVSGMPEDSLGKEERSSIPSSVSVLHLLYQQTQIVFGTELVVLLMSFKSLLLKA